MIFGFKNLMAKKKLFKIHFSGVFISSFLQIATDEFQNCTENLQTSNLKIF